MRKFLAVLLSLFLLANILAFAEQPSSGAPADMGASDGATADMGASDGASSGAPADMPEGMEASDGASSGVPADMGASDGAPAGMPGGMGFPGGGSVEGQLGSWNGGGEGDYDYDAALMITTDGIDQEKSALSRISGGEISELAADGLTLIDESSHHEGIVVTEADYMIKDADITMLTEADGTDTCDFSGIGSAVAVFGDSRVTIENSKIETAGVAVMPIFIDGGAGVTVRNSTLISRGGTLHAGYMNSPDQSTMVAPPWILGIMGTSRCTNLMGNDSTLNMIDSETSSGAWAVLSTDAGSRMRLNIVNSSLTLMNADEQAAAPIQAEGGQIYETVDNPYTVNYGSGYATFAIGSASELFAGAELNVGTYAVILTGGDVTCTSLTAGQTVELPQGDGSVLTCKADQDKATVIHSDTFGFMAHQNQNAVTLEQGTEVHTGYATFLVKTGYSGETMNAKIDGALITNGGVLIQVMDNDDATNGGMMSASDPANTNGGMQNFIPVHNERAGFSTRTGVSSDSTQTFAFTNGSYQGNIYNASGSDQSTASSGLNASALKVSFGAGAEYTGAVASTAAVHVTAEGSAALKQSGGFALETAEEAAAFAAEYQNCSFDITHYFDIGHVANRIFRNGGNTIDITLTDDAVWNVAGTSVIDSLSISGSASVVIPEGITLTVNGTDYTGCTLTADSPL